MERIIQIYSNIVRLFKWAGPVAKWQWLQYEFLHFSICGSSWSTTRAWSQDINCQQSNLSFDLSRTFKRCPLLNNKLIREISTACLNAIAIQIAVSPGLSQPWLPWITNTKEESQWRSFHCWKKAAWSSIIHTHQLSYMTCNHQLPLGTSLIHLVRGKLWPLATEHWQSKKRIKGNNRMKHY